MLQSLTSHIGPFENRTCQEAVLSLAALVSRRPELSSSHLGVALKGFEHELLAAGHEETSHLMGSRYFGRTFVAELTRTGDASVVSQLAPLFGRAADLPALLNGMLEGLTPTAIAQLADELERHLERFVAESNSELVACLLNVLSKSEPAVPRHVALARRFRVGPALLFPRSAHVSCAALRLAFKAPPTLSIEAGEESAYLSKLLQTVAATPQPTAAMAEMFLVAIEGLRHIGLSVGVVPPALEAAMLEVHLPAALATRGASDLLSLAFFDICAAAVEKGDNSSLMSAVAKSTTNEHAVGLLARLGKSGRVSAAAATQILLPSLLDRLSEGPGDHLHSLICAALVHLVVAHPSETGVASVLSVLRSAFASRGFPVHVAEAIDVLARGLKDKTLLSLVLREVLTLFLYVPIEGGSRLIPSIALALEHLAKDYGVLALHHNPAAQMDASVRRKLAQMWIQCCLHLDRLGNDAVKRAIQLAKVTPPLVFLGPDYIKSFGERYTFAVEKLESNRSRQGEFSPFVSYLLDPQVSIHGFLPQICTIGRKVLGIFLTQYLPPLHKASVADQELVSREALVILDVIARKAGSAPERRFLIEALDSLSAHWTPVLFEQPVLQRFLKIVLDAQAGKSTFTGDTERDRAEARSELSASLRRWVERSLIVAPSKATALIQECLLFDKLSGTVLLDAMGQLDRPFVYSLEKKARTIGEVAGLASAMPNIDSVEDLIQKQYSQASGLKSALLRSTAVLVSFPQHNPEKLLDALCWFPARHIDTSEVVQTAVFCWSWVIAARPDLELQLLSKLHDAWCWTVDTRKGLFDQSGEANAEGHRLWVGFLAEHVFTTTRPVQWSSNVSLLLLHALVHPFLLNPSLNAMGARFEMLMLCIRLFSDGRVEDVNAESLLRERVFMAALGWFRQKPYWYEGPNLLRDVAALTGFCAVVQNEEANFRAKFSKMPHHVVSTTKSVAETTPSTPPPHITLAAEEEQQPDTRKKSVLQSAQWKQLSVASSAIRTSDALAKGLVSPRGARAIELGSDGNGTARAHVGVTPSIRRQYAKQESALLPEVADVAAQAYYVGIESKRKLILLLVGNELDRISAWNNPQNIKSKQIPGVSDYSAYPIVSKYAIESYVEVAWEVSPDLAVHMGSRFSSPAVKETLELLVLERTEEVINVPEAVRYLLTEQNVLNDVPQLKWLIKWRQCAATDALRVLLGRFGGHPFVTYWAGTVLQSLGARKVLFYLPQLVQGLRWDKSGRLMDYLAKACRGSILICHQTLWCTAAYTDIGPDDSEDDLEFVKRVVQLQHRIKEDMTEGTRKKWVQESSFFESVTAVSGTLLPLLGQEAKIRKQLVAELAKLQSSGHLYLPTNPDTRVLGIDVESAAPMKSHAKVPILVNFLVKTEHYEDTHIDDPSVEQVAPNGPPVDGVDGVRMQACIFKVGDDVRQDMMALQIIDFCKRLFDKQHLDVFLFPYKVIATHPNEGIIEVVPNSQSRDQLGKKSDGNLYHWFLTKYGAPDSPAFQSARDCFIRSMAAYSVVSYILQVKDRHNGNILVDNEGHLIHIDFGFLFDISPGGDLRFERSPFKLTQEMVDIMGGSVETEQFAWLMELATKCFLVLRENQEEILTMVELMLGMKFPCFKSHTIENLRARFKPELNAREATKFFSEEVILASWSRGSQFTTKMYDVFQAFSNKIDF